MGPIFTSLSSAIDPKLLSKKKNFSTTTPKKNFRNGSKIDVHHFISHRWLYCQSNWKGENARLLFGSDHCFPKKKTYPQN